MTHLSTTPGDVSTVDSEGSLAVPPAGDPEEEYFMLTALCGLGFFGAVLKRPLNLYNGYKISGVRTVNFFNIWVQTLHEIPRFPKIS
jgi:hypothetical protein